MKYKGIELTEFKSDKAVLFDPPKKMLVWDSDDGDYELDDPINVYAYLPAHPTYKVTAYPGTWKHCAEIPEELKPRRATNRELIKWLAQGNGLFKRSPGNIVWSYIGFSDEIEIEDECNLDVLIRKWDDKEWHEPTTDYMGLE